MGLGRGDNWGDGAPLRVLVVDDEPGIRRTLVIALESMGHEVVATSGPGDALAEAERGVFDLALVDLRLGTASGLDLFPQLVARCPGMRVVVITAYASVDTAVETMRRGAFDYLAKPFTPAQLGAVVMRVGEVRKLERRVALLQEGGGREAVELVSASAPMARAIEVARQVAGSEASVLLRGESGTGKGVLARAIHGWSGRKDAPMASVSCPSLSAELLESELFGHARGAFTGAVRDHVGRVEAADGGTLFLDEIGDLPLGLQPKLLRFLQERVFERVGETKTRRADVRVISATNVDLPGAVKAGKFREDLYYRLNVIEIVVPALRERVEDVVGLAEQMLTGLRRGGMPVGFTEEAKGAMKAYGWPGNVRELRNVVERCAILSRGEMIGVEDLPGAIGGTVSGGGGGAVSLGDAVSLERVEMEHIRRVMARSASLEEAAATLDIDVATLWRKRRKYDI